MKVNLETEIRKRSLISDIVIIGLTKTLKETYGDNWISELEKFHNSTQKNENEDVIIDLKIIANDIELNTEYFISRWQSTVDSMFDKKIEEMDFKTIRNVIINWFKMKFLRK